jgi:hypothetical protein
MVSVFDTRVKIASADVELRCDDVVLMRPSSSVDWKMSMNDRAQEAESTYCHRYTVDTILITSETNGTLYLAV